MKRWFVSVRHLTPEQLELFGYDLIKASGEFSVYCLRYTGEDHIVLNSNPYLYVDDINDALAMRADRVTAVPDDDS